MSYTDHTGYCHHDYHADPDIERLLNDIPRRSDGTPTNIRLRDLRRILLTYKLNKPDLEFFRKEIDAALKVHEKTLVKRDSYFRAMANNLRSAGDVTRPAVQSPHRG